MIEWHELETLRNTHGDGFWLLDRELLRSRILDFRGAFVQAGWPATELAWSVKTLWDEFAIRIALEAGCLAEVVSAHERSLVTSLGVDQSRIIFNGPLKTREEIERSCADGAIVNLDNLDEVYSTIAIASNRQHLTWRVGLRANLNIGQEDRGRFGIDAEDGSLAEAFRLLSDEPNVTVAGLHLHIAGARMPEHFTRRIDRLITLADHLWPAGPEYLDIGGGFAGKMPIELARQFPYPAPTPETYADAIVPRLLCRWPRRGPRLILEPGVALAAEAMSFAARVAAVKTIGGIRHAIVSGSVMTIAPARHRYQLPYRVVRAPGAAPTEGPTVISGWTCIEDDILVRQMTGPIDVNDWLIFDNCGAYTFVLTPRFIRGIPAILVRSSDGWVASRRAETAADWMDCRADSKY